MRNVIAVVCLVMAFSSCYNDKADKVYPATTTGPVVCDTANVTYSGTIAPIISQSCSIVGCHDGTPSAIYNFKTYDGLVQAVGSDQLIDAIEHTGTVTPMPETGAPLSSCQIAEIVAWVNRGNPNN